MVLLLSPGKKKSSKNMEIRKSRNGQIPGHSLSPNIFLPGVIEAHFSLSSHSFLTISACSKLPWGVEPAFWQLYRTFREGCCLVPGSSVCRLVNRFQSKMTLIILIHPPVQTRSMDPPQPGMSFWIMQGWEEQVGRRLHLFSQPWSL